MFEKKPTTGSPRRMLVYEVQLLKVLNTPAR